MISATLDDDGVVLHLNETHVLAFGELDGRESPRLAAVTAALAGANFDSRATSTIVHELWEKWVFIAALGGITSLMRALVGDIERAGGADIALALLAECSAIAESNGFTPRPAMLERARRLLTEPGSTLTASMMKDIERGAPIEGEAIMGDLLAEESPRVRAAVAAHGAGAPQGVRGAASARGHGYHELTVFC